MPPVPSTCRGLTARRTRCASAPPANSSPNAMSTFVAIDFETATTRRDSACAVGLAAGCNGRVVLARTHLIRPPTAQFTFTDLHGLDWEDVHDAPTFAELWADAPRLDRRRGVRRRPQRTVRQERPACLLRPVPAAPATDAVHVYRAARPSPVGNTADEAARRLPAAADPAPSPRRGSRRAGVRAHRARGPGRRLATREAREASNAPDCDPRHGPRFNPCRPGPVDEPAALAGIRPPSSDVVAATRHHARPDRQSRRDARYPGRRGRDRGVGCPGDPCRQASGRVSPRRRTGRTHAPAVGALESPGPA